MKILVTFQMDENHKAALSAAAPDAQLVFCSPNEAADALETADVLIGNLPPVMLKNAKNLKWCQLQTSGANLYTPQGTLPQGAMLTCTTGSFGPIIAEYMLGYILNIYLHLDKYRDAQTARRWTDEGNIRSISGANALMIGMGNIGTEFATRFHALGGHVTGVKRTPGNAPAYLDGLYTMNELSSLLPDADIVASALPETPQTQYLYNAEFFAKMKSGALFINVGRGSAVVTQDLISALESGHLSGAALDVFEQEPVPEQSPLWHTKNLIMTPHISGDLHLLATRERIFGICLRNLERWVKAEPLHHMVDFNTGYESSKL